MSTGEVLPATVGVEDPFEAKGEVPAALAYARASGRPLEVLHAAWIAAPYQDVVFLRLPP